MKNNKIKMKNNKIKILYDHQAITMQKFGGISRYFIELMKRIPESYVVKNSVLLTENYYYINENFREKNKIINTNAINFKGKNRVKSSLNNLNTRLKLLTNKFDVIHPTYYDYYLLDSLKGAPFVITVYDMIHEKFSDDINNITLKQKKETILRANKIIAISENTKKDLIDLYNISPSKIDVVYLNHNLNNVVIEKIPNLPQNYILYVGERSWYKNFTNFVHAVKIILDKKQDLQIVCTGRSFGKDEINLLTELKIMDRFHQYFVSDSQLKYLYCNAEMFVYPSKYEGFGIPILEAFSCGCPVVLSNTSCFPEIAGEAGIYFDPENINEMSDQMNAVLDNLALKEQKIKLGRQVMLKFSWSNTVEKTLEIYNNMIIQK